MHNHQGKEKNYNNLTRNSVGKIMINKVPVLFENEIVEKAIEILFKNAKQYQTINYVYLIDENYKLKSVVSIKDIFKASKKKNISTLKTKKLITVRPSSTKEKAAYVAIKNNIKAVPVIDKDGKFLGVVPSDTILYTIYSETSKNIFHLAGIHRPKMIIDNIFELSLIKSFKHRLPWLLLGLIGGLVAAEIVGLFENTLKQNIVLAAFIPLIVYMSDAVGTQMEAFVIRDLAITPKLNFIKYFFRQLAIVFLIGIITSSALFLINIIIYQNTTVGAVLGIALFAAILSSVFTGLIIPHTLNKLRVDPANASGPVATIIQDVLSVLIYFSIASWLL